MTGLNSHSMRPVSVNNQLLPVGAKERLCKLVGCFVSGRGERISNQPSNTRI